MSKQLVIGVDANEANRVDRVGTGQYAYHILKVWYRTAAAHFDLYLRDKPITDLSVSRQGWRYHTIGPRPAWTRFALPLRLMASHHDVFWNPAHYLPPYTGCPSVVTVHDLAYEYFPELFLPKDLYKLRHWTRSSVKSASSVIAVSEATKRDLVKLYSVPAEKITVVHNGYDSQVFNTKLKVNRNILDSWQLAVGSYVLFLGTLQPRKNAIRLIHSFHLLKKQGYAGKLVIAGNIGWMADETLRAIRESPEANDIVQTGYISDETRLTLYRGADVFVLPSLYEGFGVPAIEAMACGAPVAAANNSSLPEIVGAAGVLFDATDTEDLARAILEAKDKRESLVKLGLARAKQFSWEKCAKETLKVLVTASGRDKNVPRD